jgi:hypothetical protein
MAGFQVITEVDPKEWWDAHWIQDHVARRVDLTGFGK